MLTTYSPALYNSQRLLFDQTRSTRDAEALDVPEAFYERGWAVIDDIADHDHAVAIQERLIAGIDPRRVPLHARFADRIQLGKADLIPVCDDVVATSFQVLHFDMGLPLVESADQLLVTHVGIYLPATTTHAVSARTRLVELDGILRFAGRSSAEVQRAVAEYVRRHGDGWAGCNTLRLAAFVRLVDALADTPELAKEIDKTVGQWFGGGQQLDAATAHAEELRYLDRHGIALADVEHEVALEPGQLLLLDNTRVVHGRVGKRRAREIFNFMFGVPAIGEEDVAALRGHVCDLMTA